MKHHDCRCSQPQAQAIPGVLLPRILASGREWLHRQCFDITLHDLPECARPPLALVSVSPGGDPRWTPSPCSRPLLYCVEIPLLCQVRDSCGCLFTACSSISAKVCLTPCCPLPECWRSQMMVIPCVRLVCAECSHDPCFHAQLEVLVEAWLLRWENCAAQQPCKPCCPELPLYPQPCIR